MDKTSCAFPVYDFHGSGEKFLADDGITARDYFAAKAMQSLLCANGMTVGTDESDPSNRNVDVARVAYAMADTMIKVRDQ